MSVKIFPKSGVIGSLSITLWIWMSLLEFFDWLFLIDLFSSDFSCNLVMSMRSFLNLNCKLSIKWVKLISLSFVDGLLGNLTGVSAVVLKSLDLSYELNRSFSLSVLCAVDGIWLCGSVDPSDSWSWVYLPVEVFVGLFADFWIRSEFNLNSSYFAWSSWLTLNGLGSFLCFSSLAGLLLALFLIGLISFFFSLST